jgi:L-fuculose-phosphate aldolase
MNAELQRRTAIVESCRKLARLGLVSGSAGNVSVRSGDGMLITPTGSAFETMGPDDLVQTDFDGGADEGAPSSEWEMHARIYLDHPEAGAVVHAHPDNCVALSCLRKPIPAFHYMIAGFGGDDVPCAPYHPFGSRKLAEAAAEALRDRSACLLANHGMICRDADLAKATETAIRLETLARQYGMALHAGDPVLLTPEEMAETRSRYRHYGHARIPEDER